MRVRICIPCCMLFMLPAGAGGIEALVGHSEVVMCDFAACLLAELERWMLSATPAMIDLNSFADTSDYFTAPSSALEEVSKRIYTDEVRMCPNLINVFVKSRTIMPGCVKGFVQYKAFCSASASPGDTAVASL